MVRARNGESETGMKLAGVDSRDKATHIERNDQFIRNEDDDGGRATATMMNSECCEEVEQR